MGSKDKNKVFRADVRKAYGIKRFLNSFKYTLDGLKYAIKH